MAKIRYNGLDEYMAKIKELEGSTVHIANEALYSAAGLVTDAVDKEIDRIPKNLINEVQRQGLHDGLGIAHFWQEGGGVSTRIGFDDYSKYRVGKYRISGQPNAMIARMVAKGTSRRPEHYDFVKNAVRKSKKSCIDEMRKTFDKEIEKIMKG